MQFIDAAHWNKYEGHPGGPSPLLVALEAPATFFFTSICNSPLNFDRSSTLLDDTPTPRTATTTHRTVLMTISDFIVDELVV